MLGDIGLGVLWELGIAALAVVLHVAVIVLAVVWVQRWWGR